MRHRLQGFRWLIGLSLVGLVLVGCGDDDDDGASSETTAETTEAPTSDDEGGGGDDEAFCQAAVAVDAAFAPEEPDPAEIQSAIEEARDISPDEVRDEIDLILDQLDTIAEQGPSAEFEEASAAIDEYVLDNCGFDEVEVSGVDFAFEGLPDELDAGTYAFSFTNDAEAEFHVMALVRINDDVTESLEELLQLPEEEARSKVTDVGGSSAPPGQSDVTFVELEPGRYGIICPVPVGSIGDEEGTGPPHFVEGMAAEIQVT